MGPILWGREMPGGTETHELGRLEELRLEVDWGKRIELKLMKGTAEAFGTELPLDHALALSSCKLAIFTWHGATIEIVGDHHAYVGSETPMTIYANTHAVIEARRMEAEKLGQVAPRVLITGPTDTGKSALAKILLAYAARQGRQPLFADVDPAQGCITVPGMLSSIHVDRPYNLEEGFSKRVPLVYFFGQVEATSNEDAFKRQLSALFTQIDAVCDQEVKAGRSGVIINTPGSMMSTGYALLKDTIRITRANIILVLDNDRLYNDLKSSLSGQSIDVIKLPKSGGVVTRSPDFARRSRKEMIRQYFYGVKRDLSPRVITLSWGEVALYRVGSFRAPLAALPIGSNSVLDPVSVELIDPTESLTNAIVAVSHSKDEATLLDFNVAGYLHIKSVNIEKRKLTLLAPCSLDLPSRYFLVGDIQWIDS